jgi:hypothetical protein
VDFALDPVAAEVFEQIVVCMHPVERRVRGMRLMQVAEEILDEVRERFGRDHRGCDSGPSRRTS